MKYIQCNGIIATTSISQTIGSLIRFYCGVVRSCHVVTESYIIIEGHNCVSVWWVRGQVWVNCSYLYLMMNPNLVFAAAAVVTWCEDVEVDMTSNDTWHVCSPHKQLGWVHSLLSWQIGGNLKNSPQIQPDNSTSKINVSSAFHASEWPKLGIV